uniref:Uncharacterized protein n=1 Tax=Sphenodon punctatus TaxID=8508 RepID=A0A8D0LBT6_SPHPU
IDGPGARIVPSTAYLPLTPNGVLKHLGLQVHSAVTGSYVSGTHSIAFINCPNEQIAKDIARAIMDKKLAAGINILPKTSSFSVAVGWGGRISAHLLVPCAFSCRSIHPFEIPEFISLPIDQGNPLYMKWIEESVTND